MKKIFLSAVVLFGLQNMVFAIDEIPSWNDFAPSVIKQEHQAYWDARYREFESDLNNCKALPVAQRSTCFNQLAINEREKNNSFYANPSTITTNPTVNEVRSSTFALSIGYPAVYSYRYWDYPECVLFPSFRYTHYHRVPPPPMHRPFVHHVSHYHPIPTGHHAPPVHRPAPSGHHGPSPHHGAPAHHHH